MGPGAPAADAPVLRPDGTRGWLLRELGPDFTLVLAAGGDAAPTLARRLEDDEATSGLVRVLCIHPQASAPGAGLVDEEGAIRSRYDLQAGGGVLLRPDGHVCARWRQPDPSAVQAAIRRALALP